MSLLGRALSVIAIQKVIGQPLFHFPAISFQRIDYFRRRFCWNRKIHGRLVCLVNKRVPCISAFSTKTMAPHGKNKKDKKDNEGGDSAAEEHAISESGSEEEEAKPKKTPAKGKKRGAASGDKAEPDPKKLKSDIAVPVKDLSKLDFECSRTTADGDKWNYKISSWNVAGLRACVKKDGLKYIEKESPDIICLQETKCPEKKLPPEVKLPGYHTYGVSGEKDGYAGVALYSKEKPIEVKYGLNIAKHDNEGRVITAEYEKFYVVGTYVPNAGQGLKTLPKRLEWNKDFLKYLKDLDEKKPVILCGDLNVAHHEIDLANPATNTKHAGFTKEEREGMTQMLKEGNFVDSFRHLYPDEKGAYTFWSFMGNARSRNTGWRLDYFILSERLLPSLCDNVIRRQVGGSDHCPITLFLHV